jgi:hypothetical protein
MIPDIQASLLGQFTPSHDGDQFASFNLSSRQFKVSGVGVS